MPITPAKIMTLCLIREGDNILLGMKKRGFGAGHWNGFGGKAAQDESIEDAAKRELREETGPEGMDGKSARAGIEVSGLYKAGILTFAFQDGSPTLEMHIFGAKGFTGEAVETEEMRPQWFNMNEIPFDKMWPDDVYWFPLFLAGKPFKGYFLFDRPSTPDKNSVIIEKDIEEVTSL